MKRFRLIPILVLTTLALSVLMPQAFNVQAATPTISTDLPDYPPGALVTLTGAGWMPDEPVSVVVNDDANKTWSWSGTAAASPASETDPGGSFTLTFNLPTWFVANYSVSASGPISGTATTTFTDMSIGTYDQCSNDLGDGYADGCRWINGNLERNNSIYAEGDATVQRLWLTELTPGTTHTVTLKYGTTKGGTHAYDYLTTWNWSENWITLADRCEGITGCETAAETTAQIPMDPNVPDSIEPPSAGRLFTLRGGTLNSATTPAITSGDYTGDSETIITVSFTVGSGDGSMCSTQTDNKGNSVTTCGVALWFGAHVSLSADWQIYNGTIGAGGISGSPYHVSLEAVDGASAGKRDNQMQSGAIIGNGYLKIVKDAVPDDPQDFNYKLTGGVATDVDFALDDDADATLLNTRTIPLPPGTFTLTEGVLPADWSLTGLVCSDPSGNTTVAGAVASINLASGETVTCTYTNTKAGHIIVKKVIAGTGAETDYAFTIDPSWGDDFNLTGGGSHDSGPLAAGTYSVAEIDPGAKWDLTAYSCDDGSPINAIALANGETVTCTFTNTRVWNQDLSVAKTATPGFSRTYAWDIYKNVDQTSAKIAAGGSATFNYTVGVTHDGGTDSAWTLAGDITVSNPNGFDVAGVDISDAVPGGTCTVTDGTELTVPANSYLTRGYTCAFTGAPGAGTNTATATWNAATYNTPNGSASGTAGYDFAGVTPVIAGGSVTVSDTLGGSLGSVAYTDPSPTEFTYSQTFSGEGGKCVKYDNTATISENGKFATRQVEVCAGLDLTIDKTVVPAFNRTWSWTIDKGLDATYNLFAGGSVTHSYGVTVTPTFTDSGWGLSGVITVTNPNAWPVTADVSDAVDNGGACTVTGGVDAVIPANDHLDLNYTCGYATQPTYSGTNTAVVDWSGADVPSANASAVVSKGFEFTTPVEVNRQISVDDDRYDGDAGWTADGVSTTWTYNRDFTCPVDQSAYTNGFYTETLTNTATIVGTSTADNAVVTLNCYAPSVSKTAHTEWFRNVNWTIDKSVTPLTADAFAGEGATFDYTVNLTKTVVENGWRVFGEISIANPHPTDAMTVAVADAIGTDAASIDCAPLVEDNPTSITIAAGETGICAYTIDRTGTSGGTNTATVTFGELVFSGSAEFVFGTPTHTGEPEEITVGDSFNGNLGSFSESGSASYARSETCPTSGYVDGHLAVELENTALITETGDSASATATLDCYAPVVGKTAAGTYDERHDWTVEKSVSPATQNAFAGEVVPFTWTVTVSEAVVEETFAITGAVEIHNTAPMAMSVTLSDVLDDGSPVTFSDCTSPLEIAASGTATCHYSAAPSGRTATLNTATVALAQASFDATAAVGWTPNVIHPSVDLGDLAIPTLARTGLTEGGTFTFDDSYTCSSNPGDYTNGVAALFTRLNEVTLTSGTDTRGSSQATETIQCYAPVLSKTALGKYDEVHDWLVYKSGAAAQKKFAGQSAAFNWTVRVDETTHGENYNVSGAITVVNPNPTDPMAVTLSDLLSDGAVASIGPCTSTPEGVTLVGDLLTVPAGGTATCDYSVTPLGNLDSFAAALPATVTENLTYPGPESYFMATLTGGSISGTYEGWCVDVDHTIYPNRNYTANVYSSYETLPAGLVEHPENFDLVNWIINQDFVGRPATPLAGNYTYGDVQEAIWELVEDVVPAGEISHSDPRVNQIKTLAAAHEGYVPTCGDFVAVVLQPVDGSQPITIGQVTFASLGVDCATHNAVTAVINGASFSANQLISWTPNPVNPTATLDDTQNPAWPITVSADQTFTYPDPQGYTCPNDPAAYAGDGIAPVYTDNNTATLTYEGGSKSAGASTSVTCYGPIVSKTAAAEWRKKYDWNITKTAIPDAFSGFAGDSFLTTYDVFVDQTITDYGFLASGTINVKNPSGSPGNMTVNVADMVSGGFAGTVDCDPATAGNQTSVVVAANTTKTCAYTAALPDNIGRVNTATATFNSIGFPATADVTFGAPIIEGYPTINLSDTYQDPLGSASGDQHFSYQRQFTCSTLPGDYTGYADSDVYGNTASIDETGQMANENVTVDCYIPEISKTAAGAYDERHEWSVEKTITPATQDVFAGGMTGYEWKVVVSEQVFEETFAVTGTITLVNHNPAGAMTVALSDVLSDATVASITACTGDADLTDGLTIAAGGTSTCDYTAAPAGRLASGNTATAVLNGISYSAGDPIEWTANVIRGEAIVTDDQIGLNESITEGGTFTGSEEYTCSTDENDYAGDGAYTFSEENTAIVTSGGAEEDRSSATETINCYAPVMSKTAAGTYDERHEWDVEKTVSPINQSGFAGDTLPFTWTITVTESAFEENFDAAGTITVQNPAPMAMTVGLADVLSDATSAVIGACSNGASYAAGNLTIPANTTTECGYTAADLAYSNHLAAPTGNTATAMLNGIAFTAEDPIEWAVNVIRGEAQLTDLQGPLSETITGSGTWTVEDSYTCSTDTTWYSENYSYSESILNTATLTSGSVEQDSDTSTETITCVKPEISKTAAGAYDERHEWTVTKTVSPISQSAFAGDTVGYQWTVNVEENVFEENFVATGTITVVNHNAEDALTVTLSDVLSDATAATITACTGDADLTDGLTIAAGATSLCDYTVPLTYTDVDLAPTSNTATAVLNGISYSASDPVEWTPDVIRGSATLTDEQNPAFPLDISEGGTWNYSEQYTCSTDKASYDGTTHKYSFGDSNTATLTSGDFSASANASNTVDCYVPTISKDASGTYDEVHDWEVFKSVNTASQTAFAGEKKNFTWTVRVDETTHGENYNVTGGITVVNPNPEDALTVALSDQLSDGANATITGCTGGTWSEPNLTVPAGGTATCAYTVEPLGNLASFAAALPATVTINSANPGPDSYWLTTVSNDAALNGVYEGWCVDIDHTMNPGVNYTATVYSSYEAYPTTLIEKSYNMDLVNWIINQGFVGQPAGAGLGNYTYGDVQRAIWELIEDNPTATTAGLGSWNQTRVNQIKAAATANGEGFTPTCGDFVAVLLVPTTGQQPIAIAQVTFASLGIDCANSNVATAVLNGVEFPASAEILWTANKINETATLDDDQKLDCPTTVGADTFFTYTDPQGYTCSTDPAAYTNGFYQYNESNTAVLTFTTGNDTAMASTAVKCYSPVVSKIAAGAYDERHEWDVEKTVSPTTQNAFAGDTVGYDWTVTVDESVFEENFVAGGTISVKNPRPDSTLTVKLSDVLSDGFVPTITGCTGGTWNATNQTVAVPANSTAVCTYTASLSYSDDANAPTNNTVTAELMVGTTHLVTTASDAVEWAANVIRGSATLDDDQNPAFPLEISDGGTWTYSQSATCSTTRTDYGATSFWYRIDTANTAIVTSGDERDRDSAATEVNCYWPQIDLTKSGDTLSKITDTVHYDITAFNNTPVDLGLRALSCTISDPAIPFNRTVELASGAHDENLDIAFTIPQTDADPFVNTASVTCSPLGSTFSVSDSASWSTNLFQPAVEIIKTGPAYATSGDLITYTFTINNKSSSDSPNLMLQSVSDDVLGDLKAAALTAGCDDLAYNGTCTFTATYTVPDAGLQAYRKTNVVTVHYKPAGFPNDITDTDDHTVTVTPRGQLTDTSFCPLANDQFRLLYRLYQAPNVYLLNGSNPGQFYYNAFYFGAPGSDFTMSIEIPYPFMTQEGAGNPIQVHDGTSLTSGGCFAPNPSLSGFNITTEAMAPASAAGNQIITPEDYSVKGIGETTTVTVSGTVPATGFAYVTIHLDYGLKKTQPWKATGYFTLNPATGASIGDMLFDNNGPTVHGYQEYSFSRTVGADTAASSPASYNEIKKFAGFLGFVNDLSLEEPVKNAMVEIYDPKGAKLTTLYTDEDGYYMFLYKHTAKAATYTVKLPNYGRSISVTVKANGFAALDFELP